MARTTQSSANYTEGRWIVIWINQKVYLQQWIFQNSLAVSYEVVDLCIDTTLGCLWPQMMRGKWIGTKLF